MKVSFIVLSINFIVVTLSLVSSQNDLIILIAKGGASPASPIAVDPSAGVT